LARARQHHAVDRVQESTDVRDVGGACKHQWQRARHLRYRAKVSLSDHLRRKSIFDAIGVPDHTDYRPPHRLKSNPSSLLQSSQKLGADHARRQTPDQPVKPHSGNAIFA